jgi:hypothetical protein
MDPSILSYRYGMHAVCMTLYLASKCVALRRGRFREELLFSEGDFEFVPSLY